VDAANTQTISKFLGISNVDNALRIAPTIINHEYVYPLREGNNVEIDNSYGLKSRSGYTSVKAGADIHSLWSDGKTCLYVDGQILYQLLAGYSVIAIRSGLSYKRRMSYVPINDRVYYTNGEVIGYVSKNADNHLPAPGREFKEPLPPGKFIEYYRGCLYVAGGNVLYISDPLCDYYDTRTGYKLFSAEITMLRSTDGGIYISDDRVWFVKGRGPDEFDRDEVYPSQAIPYTDLKVPGKYIKDGLEGEVAMWTSQNGICMGGGNGEVVNLTDERMIFDPTAQGAAFLKEVGHVRHYINSLF
jgi:hypothetical protein